MLLRHAYGSALRRLRLRRGLTLRQLSDASRVSLPYLSEIERGRKEASSEILATVCVVLGISVHDLLREAATELPQTGAFVLDLVPRRGSDELHQPALDRSTGIPSRPDAVLFGAVLPDAVLLAA